MCCCCYYYHYVIIIDSLALQRAGEKVEESAWALQSDISKSESSF